MTDHRNLSNRPFCLAKCPRILERPFKQKSSLILMSESFLYPWDLFYNIIRRLMMQANAHLKLAHLKKCSNSIEFLLKSCEIMSCSAKNMPQTPERSNAHDQGTAVQHWTEGSSADLKVSRPETWWCVNACLHPSRQFSTILDYLSYCPSYSFMSNANQLQSFTLCGALCSEYQCSINLIQFTVYQSMHSMLSENLTYHTVHHCATARLVSFERPALFTALKSLPCTELSSCEAKRPKDRRQVLMQLLRRKAAETVRDCTSTGMEQ